MSTLTFEKLESLLPIDKNNLDEEASRHAEYAGQISRTLALAEQDRDECAEGLKRIEGNLYLDARTEAARISEKITEAEIKASIVVQQKRIDAADTLIAAEAELKRWQGLSESWKSRGFNLRVLADLYTANYFSTSSSLRARGEDATDLPRRRTRG